MAEEFGAKEDGFSHDDFKNSDTLKGAVKSYNRNSDRSLFNKDSYIRITGKNPDVNVDTALDVQLLYTFTEDDYLFAK